MHVLVVVDMQKDFIDGSLGTEEAKEIVSRVTNRITSFDGWVLYTRDTHEENYLETPGRRQSSCTTLRSRNRRLVALPRGSRPLPGDTGR